MARRPARRADIEPPVFDPLSYDSLGAATAKALTERTAVPLSELPSFRGEGIYALYYHGDFEPYAVMSEANADGRWEMPIYVGKADPPGRRHGVQVDDGEDGNDDGEAQVSAALSRSYCLRDRLTKHARSIGEAENLNIEHFWCRFMLVNQVWIGLGEGMMISRHMPIWNSPFNGFGNNTPGAGRGNTTRSRWDTMHPGRRGAANLQDRAETQDQILEEVRQTLALRRRAPLPPEFEI